jgi:hypothetical protein
MPAARRTVYANQALLEQVDFIGPDGVTRVSGITPGALISKLFFNNSVQPWPLVSGVAVTDQQVVAGYVYFNEIPGQPGFYSVRFRPNALGYWRTLLSYPAGMQTLAQDFDVVPALSAGEGGLQASFVKPSGSGGCC